jgi:hypothetical protein
MFVAIIICIQQNIFDAEFVGKALFFFFFIRKTVYNKLQSKNYNKRSTRAYYDSK